VHSPIVSVRVLPYALPIHVPFAIATQTLPEALGCFLELVTEDGTVGLGEAAPFPVLTGDTANDAQRHAHDLEHLLLGRSPREALDNLLTHREESFRVSRSAFVGLESALWDLIGKQRGKALSTLWGTAALPSVTTDITLPIMAPRQVGDFWERYRSYGFSTLKVKVSGHVSSDVDLVMQLVAQAGPEVSYTLDGNQGFSVASACSLVEQLHRHGVHPAFFEQPLPAKDHLGLATLSRTLPLPVCLDETVETAHDARLVVDQRLGRMINLKIMKSGIEETFRILRLAHDHGLGLMIGGMLETEVAMGVSLHLCCATGVVGHVDLDTPFFMKESSTRAHPWQPQRAELSCPKGPGHGLQLREDLPVPSETTGSPLPHLDAAGAPSVTQGA
jgi:L-alanine-DL-glutamate epimerase-like enolase superfamily enzyme